MNTAKIRPEFRAAAKNGEVSITDYFYSGTARAHDALGGHCADVSCVNCGSKIAHVFMTELGPLGGDCAANITGDNSTRSEVRRRLPKLLAKIAEGRASRVWTVPSCDAGFVAIWMQVRGTGCVREHDGAICGARTDCLAVVTAKVARMLLAAVIDRLANDGYRYDIAA